MLLGERVQVTPPHRSRQRVSGARASRTSGKDKGGNCAPNKIKKFFACNPKAQYHKDYAKWHEKFKLINKG